MSGPTLQDALDAAERGEPLSIEISPAALGWLATVGADKKTPGWTPLADLVCDAIIEQWRQSHSISMPLSPPEDDR